jgi:uncharacterized protein (DUF433 family)
MNLPPFLIDHPDGEIRLVGHRINLYTIVRCYKEGMTPERMVLEFDTLSLDEIRKVVAFYEQNRAEVEPYIEAYRAELDRQYAEYKPGPGILKLRRLKELIEEEDAKRATDPEWTKLHPVEKALRIQKERPAET